ncbi:hypothetical protein L211DRAFT_838197 [Terfezia boudieri ATCC MYA-4762]|uniref:Uncharacterized protein n=1 Tax=Terfezia boudieri ATCC MYA-4762 TaxID=1051890 RepID=A0A3N4LLG9_9PEZI|nr:hypothetical protein L211DRAFT_838197 [Terfezia boudieri ATCC MYA-4762]
MPTTNPKITVLCDISSTSIDLPRPPALPPWKRTTDPNSSTSEIFTRINTFLPELRAANAQLESEIVQGRISERRIEDVGEDEEQYIEMNLGLGVLEEKKKQGPTSKRRKMDTEVLMKQVDSEDEDDHGRTGGSDGDGREEQEGSGSSGSDEETSDEGSAEEGDDDDDDECDSNSSTSSTSHTDSSAHYPQQQDEQDNESARIYALLSVLGVESTEYPQPLDGKWKRRHEERKDAQRDILAALLNIDTPPGSTGSGGSGGKGGAKRKPVIEVVEVEGKE